MKNLTIETPRTVIRKLNIHDLNDFHAYRSDPEVVKYQSFEVMSLAEAQSFIESQTDSDFSIPGQWSQFGIEHKLDRKIIGDCAIKLDPYEPRIAEVGITIAASFQKTGIAREVMNTLMEYLFLNLNIHRISETVDAENAASIALLESLDFRLEGHFIENIFFKGKWGSEMQYAMLKREWEEKFR